MSSERFESLTPEEQAQSRADALNRVFPIGLTLIIFSMLTVLFVATRLPGIVQAYQSGEGDRQMITMALAASIVMVANNLVIAYGALQIIRGKGFVFCVVALCLAMIPTLGVCYLLGVPIGLWGLWTITSPEVRRAFY